MKQTTLNIAENFRKVEDKTTLEIKENFLNYAEKAKQRQEATISQEGVKGFQPVLGSNEHHIKARDQAAETVGLSPCPVCGKSCPNNVYCINCGHIHDPKLLSLMNRLGLKERVDNE